MTLRLRRQITVEPAADRVNGLDWQRIWRDLDEYGNAMLPGLLLSEECDALAAHYPDDKHFRSRVVMERFSFGRGEYKYFRYPLPEIISELRTALYSQLAPSQTAGMKPWAAMCDIQKSTPTSSVGATKLDKPGQRLCCCSTDPEISTVCTRISTANMFFRSRSPFCCQNQAGILRVENLSSRSSVRACSPESKSYRSAREMLWPSPYTIARYPANADTTA